MMTPRVWSHNLFVFNFDNGTRLLFLTTNARKRAHHSLPPLPALGMRPPYCNIRRHNQLVGQEHGVLGKRVPNHSPVLLPSAGVVLIRAETGELFLERRGDRLARDAEVARCHVLCRLVHGQKRGGIVNRPSSAGPERHHRTVPASQSNCCGQTTAIPQ
jgi:hypothetical protein